MRSSDHGRPALRIHRFGRTHTGMRALRRGEGNGGCSPCGRAEGVAPPAQILERCTLRYPRGCASRKLCVASPQRHSSNWIFVCTLMRSPGTWAHICASRGGGGQVSDAGKTAPEDEPTLVTIERVPGDAPQNKEGLHRLWAQQAVRILHSMTGTVDHISCRQSAYPGQPTRRCQLALL